MEDLLAYPLPAGVVVLICGLFITLIVLQRKIHRDDRVSFSEERSELQSEIRRLWNLLERRGSPRPVDGGPSDENT